MLTLALGALLAAFSPQDPLALVGGVLHDGSGGPAIADSVVILRDGLIEKVGRCDAVSIPDGMRVIDVRGRHITPGLIDTHVHYSQTGWADGRPDAHDVRAAHPYEVAMAENAAHPERFHLAFLHSGVTAVFDVGGYPWTRLLRAATENDPLAPHVSAAGALLTAFDPHLSLPDQSQFVFPTDEAQARAFVHSHKAWGSDAIKVWYVVASDHGVEDFAPIVRAIGDEAKKVGIPMIVHATTLETARIAVAAGASLLVHSVEDHEVDDDFVAAIVEAGTIYCPTLTVRRGYALLYQCALDDEVKGQLDDVHPSVRARVLETLDLPHDQRSSPRAVQAMAKRLELQAGTMARNLVRLHAAGVPIAMGTDAGNPLTLHGPSVFPEMEAMQAAGLSANDVLVASTRDAARAMGRGSDLGLVAPGYVADLLVLKDDPSQDAKAWRSIETICRSGALHERASLRQH